MMIGTAIKQPITLNASFTKKTSLQTQVFYSIIQFVTEFENQEYIFFISSSRSRHCQSFSLVLTLQ